MGFIVRGLKIRKQQDRGVVDYLKILGGRIRERRKSLGFSQEDLAHESGLDRSYVGRVERGQHNLTVLALMKLCDAMRCDIASLTEGLPLSRADKHPVAGRS